MSEQRGNLKQQAAANRLHNATTEFYLSVIEQVEAGRPGAHASMADIVQCYNIFIQSVDFLLKGWTDFWTETIGKQTVNVTPDRIAFKETRRI